jgi:hemoglobin-like flavoprotein
VPTALNSTEIKLVTTSFHKVLANTDQAVFLFYNRLFAIAPETALLFKTNMSDQRSKFIQMLGQVVRFLDEPDELVLLLQQLGKRHRGYNVLPEQYDDVGAALMWMLEQTLETGFNDETRSAWMKTYAFMSEAARSAMN